MDPKRLRLVELRVSGTAVPESSVRFTPGLNLVVGASDTGKTFIFEAIDFMLGASSGLRRIPESTGYDRVYLDIDPTEGPAFTLRRAFEGGQFELLEYPSGRSAAHSPAKVLKAAHNPDPDDSLSAYLLRAIGLSGREVRTKATGEKRTLSFRDVAHLTLIDEERMIQQASPVITGQHITRTAERNVFALFLTGQDDSKVIPQESTTDRNARLNTEERLLNDLVAEKQKDLSALSASPDELPAQITKLDDAIREASKSVYASQEQIREHSDKRAKSFEELTRVRSRLLFLGEQLKRFRLLSEFYDSDRARLEAQIEASRVLHDLPEGSCPLCNQPLIKGAEGVTPHDQFEKSCKLEIAKIDAMQNDLKSAISDFTAEHATLTAKATDVEGRLGEADSHIQKVLTPNLSTAKDELQGLIKSRTTAAQGEGLRIVVRGLEERIEKIKTVRAEKVPKQTFENRASTATAAEFCKVVEELLREWKYPGLGTVSFDTDAADLVIGGQSRATKGKGHRALAYAAFTIGLMRYCRIKKFPHPGFVILDTPINPFRGPDGVGDEPLSDETKVSFFRSLADDTSGDQIIIIENQQPPDDVAKRVTYHHFTKNTAHGRYGFLPWKPPGDDGNTPIIVQPPDAPPPPDPPVKDARTEAKPQKERPPKQKDAATTKRRKVNATASLFMDLDADESVG